MKIKPGKPHKSQNPGFLVEPPKSLKKYQTSAEPGTKINENQAWKVSQALEPRFSSKTTEKFQKVPKRSTKVTETLPKPPNPWKSTQSSQASEPRFSSRTTEKSHKALKRASQVPSLQFT